MARQYKFQTSGQQISEVRQTPFTLVGRSLIPLPVVNVQGFRDAAGNLIVTWYRQSRIAPGLGSGRDVPLAQENEWYDIEVMNGSNVVRTFEIRGDTLAPVVWYDFFDDPAATVPFQRTRQRLDKTRSLFSVMMDFNDGSGGVTDGEIDLFFWDAQYATRPFAIQVIGSGTNIIDINASDLLDTISVSRPAGQTSVKIRFEIENGQALIFADQFGESELPIYRCATPAIDRMAPEIISQPGVGASSYSDAIIRLPPNNLFYSAALQTVDFGSLPTTITLKIYQVSSVIGRGRVKTVTL